MYTVHIFVLFLLLLVFIDVLWATVRKKLILSDGIFILSYMQLMYSICLIISTVNSIPAMCVVVIGYMQSLR